MSDKTRFENSKQLLLGIFGVISTLTTFEVVRQWDHLRWGYLLLAFSAVLLFLDKLEYLECLHPDGKDYSFQVLLFDIVDVSAYALGLSVLIDKPEDASKRHAVFFFTFAFMFLLFLARVLYVLRRVSLLNLGSLVGLLATAALGFLYANRKLADPSINATSVVILLAIAAYLVYAQCRGRHLILGQKAGR